MHPGCALSGLLPSESAIAFRGLLNVRPCTCSKLARIVRASLRPFLRTLAATQGPHWAASCRRSNGGSYFCSRGNFLKEQAVATTQCRDARIHAQPAPFAVPSIAGEAGNARRVAAMDRRDCEAVQGRTV